MKTDINHSINRYKRKYYINLILKGTIYILTVLLSAYLFFNLIEYQFHASSIFRAFLFFTYLCLCVFVLYKWFLIHLFRLLIRKKQISDDEAARSIGSFFPDIRDKLLNLIQLKRLKAESNGLVEASIDQKTNEIIDIPFDKAISLKDNLRFFWNLVDLP